MQPRLLLTLALLPTLLLACDAETGPDPAERRSKLAEHRELTRAHLDTAIEERLAAGQQLLVDPKLTEHGDQTRHVLLSGALPEAPTDIEALLADPALRARLLASTLHGGQDSAGPAIFDEVPAGHYTACMAASAPAGPEQAAFLARATALYGDGELDGEKLNAVIAQVKAETDYDPKRVDWRSRPLRCKSFEVTEDAASRIVELD
jgi:hypothetical protein